MSAPESLLDLAARVVDSARPGEQLEVYAARGTTTSVRAYEGAVEAFTQAASAGIGVRIVVDGRQGFASAGSLEADVVALLVDEARDNARFAEPDEANGLAEPDNTVRPQLDLWRDDVAERSADWKIEQAIELERMVRGADARIVSVRAATYADSQAERVIVTSSGIRAFDHGTFVSQGVSALARDESGTTIGAGATYGRSTHELDKTIAARDAVARALESLGATKPDTARVAVVFEPRFAATFVGLIASMLSATSVLKGRTLFADRLHDTVASPLFTLVDDPTDARSFGADVHDAEGVVSRRVPLIAAGVLQGFLHNTYTARRMGTQSTASASRGARSTPGVGAAALCIAPGTGTLDQLIAGVDLGLFVTSLSGLHSGVNAVSGDFSVGVEGRMIRRGALAEPIREATLGSTLPRLLGGIAAVGADLEWQPGGTGAVSLLIGDVTLSGN